MKIIIMITLCLLYAIPSFAAGGVKMSDIFGLTQRIYYKWSFDDAFGNQLSNNQYRNYCIEQ